MLEVIDGDTLRVRWEGRSEFLRYYGVNTPEKDEACYGESTERNRRLAGGRVRLAFDERSRDKYGRLLAYVFTEQGLSIDAALAGEGLARAWRRDGRFKEDLTVLELRAREGKTGCLWAAGQTPAKAPRRRRRKK